VEISQSGKLSNVCYDIRGPVLKRAMELEAAGQRILKLHIGNPAPFGFEAPAGMLADMIASLPQSHGYSDSKGILPARLAVAARCAAVGIDGVSVEDIYLGNGVSELIVMTLQALLNDGDQVLIPAPDYPLWTAGVSLSGGQPVHYLCDEADGWQPDLADIEAKITPRTRAIVIINPNNPTGAVYSRAVLEQIVDVARRHDLLIFADEIYDRILYDDARHVPIASLAPDLLCLTFGGLSKNYRVAGFRSGWVVLSGPKAHAQSYIEGLDILANMRLCPNVPGQQAIAASLGSENRLGDHSINDLVLPTGRLGEQRDRAAKLLAGLPGVSCVRPMGALYVFPRLDPAVYPIADDVQFAFDLLEQQQILVVQGTGFNWPGTDHFRVVTLQYADELEEAIGRIGAFLETIRR
jgi:alanine-synthesizing transaminase